MARRELRRKITATVLTVTALCCLLGVCAWLLLGSNVFSDTIRIMMLVCTVVLGVATIGLLVAKVQEIRALREIIRSEDAQQQSEAETPRPELAPLQTLDHTTIELPPLPDIPAPAAQPAPKQAKQQPKTKQGRSKNAAVQWSSLLLRLWPRRSPCCSPLRWCPPRPSPRRALYSKRRSPNSRPLNASGSPLISTPPCSSAWPKKPPHASAP